MYFNPRPREEGDNTAHIYAKSLTYFNPRPREEGDCHYPIDRPTMIISIHALVKRATFCQNMATQHAIDFNPRPREEGDMRFISADKNSFYFNPRPREEGDCDCIGGCRSR